MSSEEFHDSPPWNRTLKVIVALITLLLASLLAWRFSSLIGQLVSAAILAYILNPIVNFIDKHSKLNRTTILITVYLLLAAGVIWALAALGVAAFQQVDTLINLVPDLVQDVTDFIQDITSRTDPITIGTTFKIDPDIIPWDKISNQLLGLVEPIIGQSGQIVGQLATTTLRWVGILFLVFMLSIYIALEIPRLGSYVGDFAQQPGYRQDAERLTRDFGRVWSAYLRGQVILGLVIFILVWVGLSILGVQNALALGLLAGLLEFVPTLGPVISAGVAIVVAFFQPANYLGLPGWQFALAVLLLMFIIQQLENNLLVPRIVGEALDLHPIIVIIGVFMGGSLAGILGAVLAAPVVATGKLVGTYAWRKMFDLPPFPEPEEERPSTPSLRERSNKLLSRIKLLVKGKKS